MSNKPKQMKKNKSKTRRNKKVRNIDDRHDAYTNEKRIPINRKFAESYKQSLQNINRHKERHQDATDALNALVIGLLAGADIDGNDMETYGLSKDGSEMIIKYKEQPIEEEE